MRQYGIRIRSIFLNISNSQHRKRLVIAPADYQINNGEHEVYNEDANSLIKRIEGDIYTSTHRTTPDNTAQTTIC